MTTTPESEKTDEAKRMLAELRRKIARIARDKAAPGMSGDGTGSDVIVDKVKCKEEIVERHKKSNRKVIVSEQNKSQQREHRPTQL